MNADIEAVTAAYLDATNGDVLAALQVAISDLLDVQAEVALRTAALDQWVSRGYIQGRASDVLSRRLAVARSLPPPQDLVCGISSDGASRTEDNLYP